jgi:hypothetical protein
MTRRLLAAAVAAVSLWAVPVAHAAPATTTVHVVTTAASQPLPATFVTAAWSVGDKDRSDLLKIGGFNPAGCATTVTGTWQGTRHGDRSGRLLDIAFGYSNIAVPTGSDTHLLIEYRLGGVWREAENFGILHGSFGVGPDTDEFVMTYRTRAVAGRTVPVRVTVEITYQTPTVNIADTFRVLPQK